MREEERSQCVNFTLMENFNNVTIVLLYCIELISYCTILYPIVSNSYPIVPSIFLWRAKLSA